MVRSHDYFKHFVKYKNYTQQLYFELVTPRSLVRVQSPTPYVGVAQLDRARNKCTVYLLLLFISIGVFLFFRRILWTVKQTIVTGRNVAVRAVSSRIRKNQKR